MRLGQLARRYDITNQEVNSYIKKIDPTSPTLHPNAKLDEQLEAQLIAYYDDFLGAPEKEVVHAEEQADAAAVNIEDEQDPPVQDDTNEIDNVAEPIDANSVEQTDVEEPEPEKQRETIETDRLLELLESEDEDVDLSKITHIKVPKKELSGLKVLGKIEIQEPKKKFEEASTEDGEKSSQDERKKRQEARRISEEEREKRRLRAKRKKKEYEARELKRKQEHEERKMKDQRKARYEQRLGQAASSKKKPKTSVKTETVTSEVYHPLPQKPKSIFGRFWKWLNSY